MPDIPEGLIEYTLAKLPNKKAPGPDEIPNEALKLVRKTISPGLSRVLTDFFKLSEIPQSLKESTTIALRKEGKGDYTLPGSYRPITLENTLAKLVEKIVAEILTNIAEKHNLIPWNQMGARKRRLTLSAIKLLIGCIQTAWKTKKFKVVTLLSLDLAGAFNNVSHTRLLHILFKKNVPR